jgi:uncharacterized membrane protein
VGAGGRALALSAGLEPLALTAVVERFLDRPAEVLLAATTIFAVIAVATGLPPLLRDREAGRSRVTAALVVLTGGAGITFVSYLGFALRCGDSGCEAGSGTGFGEFDRWWRDESTWQWGGQLMLAALALGAAALAFLLSARAHRRRRVPLVVAWVLYGLWALLVFAAPAAYELAS